MDKKSGPLSWLKKWLKLGENGEKKPGKIQYMVLVLCIGAAFMLAGNILFKPNGDSSVVPAASNKTIESEDVETFGVSKSSGNKTIADYEEKYENRLKAALEELLGAKDVTVFVNIDSTDKKVFEKNSSIKSQTTEEGDREGGQRKVQESTEDEQIVIIRNGEKEVPIIVETKKPELRVGWILQQLGLLALEKIRIQESKLE